MWSLVVITGGRISEALKYLYDSPWLSFGVQKRGRNNGLVERRGSVVLLHYN